MTVPDKYYLIKKHTAFDEFLLDKYKATESNQKQLIQHLGVSKGTWENRRKDPAMITLKEVFLLADFFSCNYQDVVSTIHQLSENK